MEKSSSIFNSRLSILESVNKFYNWTHSLSDNRTKGWLMVDSPAPTVLFTVLYLSMVYLGPKMMKNRDPFRLTWILVPYNLTMAILNLYIAIEIANAVWWYYFSKLLEFSDTLFFILRKKENQLTFLHVYHHSTIFSLWWIGTKYVPSGSTFFPAMVNSSIHVLMYTYYGLSALGPNIVKYLWWKKYLTMIQLIQFTTALILGINGIRSGCEFPIWLQYVLVVYMISFIVLFGNFYAKAYFKKELEMRQGDEYEENDMEKDVYSYEGINLKAKSL